MRYNISMFPRENAENLLKNIDFIVFKEYLEEKLEELESLKNLDIDSHDDKSLGEITRARKEAAKIMREILGPINKLEKRKGNSVDVKETLAKYGL